MSSIEHLGPNASLLLSCSSNEAELRELSKKGSVGSKINFEMSPEIVLRLAANPMILLPPAELEMIQGIIDSYDPKKCKSFVDFLAASDTWQVPTLIRVRAMELADDPAFASGPNLRYIAPQTRQMWREVLADFNQKSSPEKKAILAKFFPFQLKFVKLMDDAGVKMLAGSDFGGQWLIPGYSLHQEFDLLEQAGLSPLTILQMATLNGAKFLGREANMGTVEPGKDANLVLLDANPIASAQNLHAIYGVIRDGVYYSQSDIQKLKAAAVQSE